MMNTDESTFIPTFKPILTKDKVNKKKLGEVTTEDLKIKIMNEFDRYQSYDVLDVSIKVPIFMAGRTQARNFRKSPC